MNSWIEKCFGMRKEFVAMSFLLILCALYLVVLAFAQSPFNSFEDDAAWLLPSLAWDMSSLPWSDQLARDVGERGAISLNMMLRFLYMIFEGWPTGYILFGIFAHTLCTFLLFVALRRFGFERLSSLMTVVAFYFCALQSHAIFWIIGVQHILALGSILVTCILAQHFFRLVYCQHQKLKVWHYASALILLLFLGVNRASVVINFFSWSLFFVYYALKLGCIADQIARHASTWRLYAFYVSGMLCISAFTFYQLAHHGEGWQVINLIQHAGIPVSFARYFANEAYLYIGLICVLALIGLLTFGVSSLKSNVLQRNFASWCYFSGIAGIFAILLSLKKTRYVLPALLENLFFIPDMSIIQMRWSPVDVFRFESLHTTQTINTVLCLALLLLFVYVRPRKDSAKLFGATLFLMIMVGLIYFYSLTNPPLSLNALPGRYAYYFMPAILLGLAGGLVRFFTVGLRGSCSYVQGRLSCLKIYHSVSLKLNVLGENIKWPFIKVFALLSLLCVFVVLNIGMLSKRLDGEKIDALYNMFASNRAFLLAESIASWAKASEHIGDISINLDGYKGTGWYMGPFMPPSNSIFDSYLFNTQAYLTQILDRGVRLHSVSGSADIMFCGDAWYGRTHQLATEETVQCKVAAPSSGGKVSAILQEGGVELRLLEPRLLKDSVLLQGKEEVKPDLLRPRYAATLAEGIDFSRNGYPDFLEEVSGLSGLEGFGRWTDAPMTRLRFRKPLPREFTLLLRFGAIEQNVGKPTVLRVGGVERALIVTNPSSTEYAVYFDGVEDSDTIEIIPFSHAGLSDLDPKNPDMRALGLTMNSLKIK